MNVGRRRLLQGLGVAGALACLARSTRGKAEAPKTGPKRLVVVGWSNGVQADKFFPAPGLLGTMPEVLRPLADAGLTGKTAVLSNLRHPAASESRILGHQNFITLLSGVPAASIAGSPRGAGGPTFDHVMAERLAALYGATPYRNLAFATMGAQSVPDCMSWRGPDAPIKVTASPGQMFDAIFGAVASPEERARLRAAKRSILDLHRGELERISTTLSASDRPRLEEHLASVRTLEQELDPRTNDAIAACGMPGKPGELDVKWANFSEVFPQVAKLQSELIVTAMKCNLTRVCTLQLLDAAGEYHSLKPGNALGIDVPRAMNIHYDVSHGGYAPQSDGYAAKTAWDRYQVGVVAALAKRFQDTPEGAGTMLDNTVIVALNSFANGASHGSDPVPAFVVSGAPGIKGGVSVDVKGASVNQLLVTVARALGVDIDTFGSSAYGSGAIAGVAA